MVLLSQGSLSQSLYWPLTQPLTHYLFHYMESTPMAEHVLFPFGHQCLKQEQLHSRHQ